MGPVQRWQSSANIYIGARHVAAGANQFPRRQRLGRDRTLALSRTMHTRIRPGGRALTRHDHSTRLSRHCRRRDGGVAGNGREKLRFHNQRDGDTILVARFCL